VWCSLRANEFVLAVISGLERRAQRLRLAQQGGWQRPRRGLQWLQASWPNLGRARGCKTAGNGGSWAPPQLHHLRMVQLW
jgi:hypothetical protein